MTQSDAASRRYQRPVLAIIGCSRSGTTWLQHLLARQPAFVTTVELTTFSHYLPALAERFHREQRLRRDRLADRGLGFITDDDGFREVCRRVVDATYEFAFPDLQPGEIIVEKNPESTRHVELIADILPNVRFLHLLRDGHDVAASLMAAGREMNFAIHTPEKAARTWVELVSCARHAADLGAPFLEVRFESLRSDPLTALRQIAQFCEVDYDGKAGKTAVDDLRIERLRESRQLPADDAHAPIGHFRRGEVGGWRDELEPWEIWAIDEIAGALLVDLGYADEPESLHDWDALRARLRLVAERRKRSLDRRLLHRGAQRRQLRLPGG